MNITLNTNNITSQYQYQYRNNNTHKYASNALKQPSFGSVTEIPAKSGLLNPFKRGMDKFTTWLSDNYFMKLYSSNTAKFLAKRTKNLNGLVDHMQVMGSVIISGMYMTQTLRNQALEEDRKKTLAINQGLTFALATIGGYTIDSSLDSKWEKFTVKYAQKQTGDPEFANKIKLINDEKIKKAEEKFGKPWKKIPKKQRPKLTTALQYIEDNLSNASLESKIRGMGVLKKLVVFGTVYRFLSPVLVTPIATKIGNMMAANKKQNTQKT